MKKLPTFALITTRMDGWYQSQAWHGVSAATRILGIRFCAFIGSGYGDPFLRGGPPDIYRLAHAEEIEGYLVLTGALMNFVGLPPLHRLMEFLPKRPTISLGVPLLDFPTISPDGGGMDKIAHHLLGHHGFRRILYIGGPSTNPDAARRRLDWLHALAQYGVEPDPTSELFGDFTPESGHRLMLDVLARNQPLPQAVVCANDAMVIGVHSALRSHGIQIPRDIVLTGYDDIEESRAMLPPLTTIRSSTYLLSFRGAEALWNLHRGLPCNNENLGTELVVRRSCGCRHGTPNQGHPRHMIHAAGIPDPMGIRHILSNQDSVDHFLMSMEATLDHCEHAEIDLWEESLNSACAAPLEPELAQALLAAQSLVSQARHGLDIRRRQALQHLMREQFAAVQSLTANPSGENLAERILDALRPFSQNHLRLLLFREDLRPVDDPVFDCHSFQLEIDLQSRTISRPIPGHILPVEPPQPGTWANLSLSLGHEHFGIVQVRDWNSNELFMESLRHSLTLLLSSAHKATVEAQIKQQLRDLSGRDDLTGLLNRRGFLEHGGVLVRTAQRTLSHIAILLCDLDGLKRINDQWGHPEGDLAIRCLSDSLRQTFRESDVVARLGGDEFAVIAMIEPGEPFDGVITRLRECLLDNSRKLARDWTADTSIGLTCWDPSKEGDLESALAKTDQILYEDKRRRKTAT